MTTLPATNPQTTGWAALATGTQRLEQYVRDVLDGTIIACKKVRMACQRHLDDLERSRNTDWPYRFDEDKANRVIGFFERFLSPSKGDITTMRLMPWQCFIEGSLYGWVDKETGLRRYREGLVCVGRGNGKSTLMAGNSGYLASKDGERGADVYLLANTKEQAGIVFRECATQIQTSPALAKHFRVLRDSIHFDRTHSTIQHRASDSRKLDGLNPHGAIFDEIHAMRDFKLINVIKRGMNKRKQPLAMYITTMGSVLDGPLMYYYGLFTDAMEGNLRPEVSDRMFAFIAEMDPEDDIEDSRLWIKANPSIGVLLDLETLKADWARCKQIPAERADFINKQLDIFTDAADMPFVDYDVIRKNEDWIDLGLLEGRACYGGFDLSLSEDMTAAGLGLTWMSYCAPIRVLLALLLDDVIYGELALEDVPLGDAIRQVMAHQAKPRWVLGDCDFDLQVTDTLGNETILSAIRRLCGKLTEDYTWDYDTHALPFVLHIRRADQDNGCGIHFGQNMVGVNRQMDATKVVTRLYLLGGADDKVGQAEKSPAEDGADDKGKQVTVESLTESGVPYIDADTILPQFGSLFLSFCYLCIIPQHGFFKALRRGACCTVAAGKIAKGLGVSVSDILVKDAGLHRGKQ